MLANNIDYHCMFTDDCRTKVGELGAIPRIVHALEASPDHRGVHFTGASALSLTELHAGFHNCLRVN